MNPDAYERQLRAALFDAETGGQSFISDDVPLEMQEQFHAQIRAFEAQHQQGKTVTVGSLLGEVHLVPPNEIRDEATLTRETSRLLGLLQEAGIMTDVDPQSPPLEPSPYYGFLHDLLLAYELVPPVKGQLMVLSFEEVITSMYSPGLGAAEIFLSCLLNLDLPFPDEVLNPTMRLENKSVERSAGLAFIREWRKRFTSIAALSFGELVGAPDVPAASPDQVVQLFGVAYEVTYPDGTKEVFEGPGVMEFVATEAGELLVSGAQFPGFEL